MAGLMERVGLDPAYRGRYPHQFSGGQRQRIGIARALAVKPQFIVCDESVAALDVSIQAQIINLFMDLKRDLGLTYLFISHDIGVVKHISDRVAIMYLGRIVESAPADAFFAQPNHPYTVALLDEVPSIANRRRVFSPIKGEIPSPLRPPSGCHFHPRCPHAFDRCRAEAPKLREIASGHISACHLNDDQSAIRRPEIAAHLIQQENAHETSSPPEKPGLVASAGLLALSPALAADLIIGSSTEPSALDPHFSRTGNNQNVAAQIFDRLIAPDPNLQVTPALAESWQNVDPTTWRIKLRSGVSFQDGAPLTAEDVIYSLDRVKDIPNSPAPFTRQYRRDCQHDGVDPQTIEFKTKSPRPTSSSRSASSTSSRRSSRREKRSRPSTTVPRRSAPAPTRSRNGCRATTSRSCVMMVLGQEARLRQRDYQVHRQRCGPRRGPAVWFSRPYRRGSSG